MKKCLIAPSILSADFKYLEKEIKKVEEAGADFLHFDVMDGHFVKNISFGIPVLKSIANCHHLINDVHIMISNPLEYAKTFVDSGADYVTFHYEACKNDDEINEIIDIIHASNGKAGLSIKPNTPLEVVFPFLEKLDLVLIMSVEPGFGGQSFIKESLGKILRLRTYIDLYEYKTLIEVDGGINDVTGPLCKQVGADILVSGSYIFKSSDVASAIEKIK